MVLKTTLTQPRVLHALSEYKQDRSGSMGATTNSLVIQKRKKNIRPLAQKAYEEEVVGPEKEPLKMNPTEGIMGRAESHVGFEPKPGSLIPVRRRLVKTLMLDYTLKLVFNASASQARNAGNHTATRSDRRKRVYPYPPEYGYGQI